jgi:beta-glucanase (GH16 family)
MARHGEIRGSAWAALALALSLGCGLMPPEEEGAPQEQPPPPPPPVDPAALPPPGSSLAWQEEFEGAGLSNATWNVLSLRRQDAVTSPDAVAVTGGRLVLSVFTDANGVHRTGFVNTEGKMELRYGYFEARIRFHTAPGSWCAFWLSSWSIGNPLGDPGRAGVEIDVVEHRVTDQGGWDELRDMVALNLNWDGYDENKKNVQLVRALPGGAPVQGEWHVYSVLWTPEGYTFYVDAMPLWTPEAPISHRPQDVHLTCEVDDGSWAGFVPPGGYGPRGTSTAGMEVDWVRAWRLPGT